MGGGQRSTRGSLWLVLAIAQHASWPVSEAKVLAGTVKFGDRSAPKARWAYITKFGYLQGTANYSVRFKVLRPKTLVDARVHLEIFLDEQWPEVTDTKDACDKKSKARKVIDVDLLPSGRWSRWENRTTRQRVRPHIWYFALSDCNNNLPELNNSYTVRFEFMAQQEDGSHFSVEQQWMLVANIAVLLHFNVFMWYFSRWCYAFFNSTGSVHPVIWTLVSVVLTQYVAQCLRTGHLALYSSDGSGSRAMDVLSEVLFILSQILQSTLLILIALGYTLLQKNLGTLDIVIPLGFIVALVHVIVVVVGKLEDDASHSHHEHSGVAGYILLVLRLGLWLWFQRAVSATAAEGGLRLRSFLQQFRIAASFYFLAYPVIFLVVPVFAQYWRATIMSSGLMMMQIVSNLWLSSLFLQRGDYFKVSTLNSSLLPGGCRVGLDKEE